MTPRCFVARHGETEWSLNGRHTGSTELPLTENGRKRIRATGNALVGDDRLIAPKNLLHVFVSPRKRARDTLHLLGLGVTENESEEYKRRCDAIVSITDELQEWNYGDYEGLKSAEIRKSRTSRGMDKERPWDIFKDGCEGGESPEQVTARCDDLIARIRSQYHAPAMSKSNPESNHPADVLCVAHGHILRAFAMRWIGKSLDTGPTMLLEAGGVGTLSYEHDNVDEPAILLGGSFVVDIVEKVEKSEPNKTIL